MPCLLHSGTQAWGKDAWWWLDGALPSSPCVSRDSWVMFLLVLFEGIQLLRAGLSFWDSI